MAEFVDRFNCIALVECFNHLGRMQECDYAVIEPNTPFRVIYISIIEDGRIVLSLIMGDSLGQVFLPNRFINVFSTSDLYRINGDLVRFCLTIKQPVDGSRHLEMGFLER